MEDVECPQCKSDDVMVGGDKNKGTCSECKWHGVLGERSERDNGSTKS